MTLAVLLLLYSLVVGCAGPRLLGRLSSGGVAPRLALTAWVGAIGGVLLAWAVAAALVGRAVLVDSGDLHEALVDCLHTLGLAVVGGHGPVLQLVALTGAISSLLAVGAVTGRLALALGRARTRTHRHCATARLVADPVPGSDGVVILDSAERLVYCVAGRPPAIVVTRGALDALDGAQLAAVIAHERAHLAGRHHLLIAASRAVSSVLPRLRLFREGADAIAHLVEMCADDVATRHHARSTLVGALLTLSDLRPAPRSALAANGADIVTRVERLLAPSNSLRAARLKLYLTGVTIAVAVGPLAAASAVALIPDLCSAPFA